MDHDSEEEEQKIEAPPIEPKYSELPKELLEKVAYYANEALAGRDALKRSSGEDSRREPSFENRKDLTQESRDKEACVLLCRTLEKDKAFEDFGQGEWQCIIGKKFACSLTYDTGVMAFFNLTQHGKSVLVFKSG